MKFGQREHMEALRKGQLYLNPQGFFAKIENDDARRDPLEATDQIHQPRDITRMTIAGPIDERGARREIVILPKDMAGPVSVRLSSTPRYNLFCMYGIRAPLAPPFVDERCFGFGDSCVLILNTQAFLDKVCAAVKAAGFNCEYRFVEHFDADAHSGETGVFRKPSGFDYQREFRIAVWPGLDRPLQLDLDSLKSITTPVLALSEINQLVDFSEAAAREAGLSRPLENS